MTQTNKTPESKVESLFNKIAPNYDKMNSLISLGNHQRWRKIAMQRLEVQPGNFAIDLCCGTGDWTISLAKAVGPAGQVVGLDFSKEMLKIADEKIKAAGVADRVTLVEGDAMHLPFDDNKFDVATIGFGLRNVPDADQVLREMVRVVRTNGKIACLETSQPTNPAIKLGWSAYFKTVPVMAKLAVDKYREYHYLQRTTKQFVSAEKLAQMFEDAGMHNVTYRTFTFGAAALHLGRA
ncbi:demethylmenaquinone methyltransferase [Lentilactobacillus farraginis]|uniref:Demethylmenaquinone methyltransferase n=1 Tax=Lentilactobacillus farraginis DSM 18382 = JCM 14108 TaxID=1423743 RepID=X0P9X0_9LACO|nr:demethylmenaquinone methyltransferase [Lentilactobacillus farraginis]KRM08396.1 ubiquinone menaquinone biosynthesis methyltransferase [Lentilactobacillus farraginis DSM 18382 = JCM 14108]GAF35843.1 ubiquinone/menaquinone biosynthesis methyltransferase UbiE [Lentilactobacillus farraginis DSM 18382 = JCM 14108]